MRTERVGFALCGSFCTHEKALTALKRLTEEYETVIPIVSENAAFTDTRFGTSDALLEQLEELTGHEVLYDIPSVEPLGPKGMIDVLVIAPCTGNTLAKLAHGITDTTVTMAAKSHLRCGRPVVIAFSTNDGLSASAKNIGELLNRKHYYGGYQASAAEAAVRKNPNPEAYDFYYATTIAEPNFYFHGDGLGSTWDAEITTNYTLYGTFTVE